MKFIEKNNESDFFNNLDKNINKFASVEESLQITNKNNLLSYLNTAAKNLQDAGFLKEAQMVVTLQEVCSDPAMENLTSEQMVKNLEEKGWVFNAEDCHSADTCDAEDCAMCSEGEQPQLSQEELKKLRNLLK